MLDFKYVYDKSNTMQVFNIFKKSSFVLIYNIQEMIRDIVNYEYCIYSLYLVMSYRSIFQSVSLFNFNMHQVFINEVQIYKILF